MDDFLFGGEMIPGFRQFIRATCRAFILSPNASSTSGGGPMNVTPAAATARAKPDFSLKNP